MVAELFAHTGGDDRERRRTLAGSDRHRFGNDAEVLLLDNVTVTPEGSCFACQRDLPDRTVAANQRSWAYVTDPRVAGVTARVADSLRSPDLRGNREAVWLLTEWS